MRIRIREVKENPELSNGEDVHEKTATDTKKANNIPKSSDDENLKKKLDVAKGMEAKKRFMDKYKKPAHTPQEDKGKLDTFKKLLKDKEDESKLER